MRSFWVNDWMVECWKRHSYVSPLSLNELVDSVILRRVNYQFRFFFNTFPKHITVISDNWNLVPIWFHMRFWRFRSNKRILSCLINFIFVQKLSISLSAKLWNMFWRCSFQRWVNSRWIGFTVNITNKEEGFIWGMTPILNS